MTSRPTGDRSQSVPPTFKHSGTPSFPRIQNHIKTQYVSEPHITPSPATRPPIPALDIVADLHRSGAAVVKTRTGSVLSRGCILKTDNFPSGRALDLDLSVQGAPNFRAPRSCQGDHALNVYGVAQPRMQGLKAILSILKCRPGMQHPTRVVWFSTREEPVIYIHGRPFVLRDSSEPRKTLALSDRAENLEAIELRLKHDILQESLKFGALILTHNEIDASAASRPGALVPTWTAVDAASVKTPRELWEDMKLEGWNVDYHRIPISPERPIEYNYLDAYVRVIVETDPLRTALVFSSSFGAGRTTFGMVAALLVRRRQRMLLGLDDPYEAGGKTAGPLGTGTNTPTGPLQPATENRILQAMELATVQKDMNKSILRLTHLLQQCLEHKNSQSAIELLLAQPALLENLRRAHMGNYGVVLSLLGCLDTGSSSKRLVDRVIDDCDAVKNVREEILRSRIRYALTSMDEAEMEMHLDKAVKAIEKYLFTITFASYVESQKTFSESFSDWLEPRTEIRTQLMFVRKSTGSRLNVFAPVHDLSALSKTGLEGHALVPGQMNDVVVAGGQILGDEYSDHVIKNRSGIILREGMLLKSDQWLGESHRVKHGVRGAINFRNIPNSNVYALGQPTVEAIEEVVTRVREGAQADEVHQICWITLREEPIVYVNGAPYCLRRERYSLRNMKDYGGISGTRLEALEERLRDDVIAELNAFGGRLLLHTETPDGSVIPVWEEVRPENVMVLKGVMAARNAKGDGIEVMYRRVPITAEHAPDLADLRQLIELVIRSDSSNAPIVLNCQLGRGRSTTASVIVLLIQRWLEASRAQTSAEPFTPRARSISSARPPIKPLTPLPLKRHTWRVINNLLRVIKKGPTVKSTVDDAIDRCAEIYHLRDAIGVARVAAEEAEDERKKRTFTEKGLHHLKRYFELIVFQSYLQSTEPDTLESIRSIETFFKERPVIKTFQKELMVEGFNALIPLQHADEDDVAHPDEAKQVVMNRSGNVLSASTILKSDFFVNMQKMSLPERIEGTPNFRRVPLTLKLISSRSSSPDEGLEFVAGASSDQKWVSGCGISTIDGLRRTLMKLDAGPDGGNTVFWTSLREEPVVYVAGRPHVLQLLERPLENVEATGVTTAVVEAMEDSLKKDVLHELRVNNGRILLHDEVEDRPGSFSIISLWEHVGEDEIMTPRDVFRQMVKEGFKVNFARIAITDEQAPLPGALSQLLERVQSGYASANEFVFNCQMGRGRTTTGMVTACLIATTMNWKQSQEDEQKEDQEVDGEEPPSPEYLDSMDGLSEEEAYLQGEYKMILQLVGVLSHGKVAKRLTDRAVDLMQDMQNLRRVLYDYKLMLDTGGRGPKLKRVAVNYLYRYGTLIVFANYLIEMQEANGVEATFPEWLREHREITMVLRRQSLD